MDPSLTKRIYDLITLICILKILPAVGDWSEWGSWSECSRTCAGGASYQLRQCQQPSGACAGHNIRYTTCNNQQCPSSTPDFRGEQCAAYNDVAYRGVLYAWAPLDDASQPCALRCTAVGHGFSVVLAPKVLDGTRCNNYSRGMCINGQCRAVGCDNMLGSGLEYDACGDCGGNATSCTRRTPPDVDKGLYVWQETDFRPCSNTCGVGHETTGVMCRDARTGTVVYSVYCNEMSKPLARTRACTGTQCQSRWITGEWGPCSGTCGTGLARRSAFCVRDIPGDTFSRIDDTSCPQPRPETQTQCQHEAECPEWVVGDWAPCPVTCGQGVQHRTVACRAEGGLDCRGVAKPESQRPCGNMDRCHIARDPVGNEFTEWEKVYDQKLPELLPTVYFIDTRPQRQEPPRHSDKSNSNILYFKQAERVSFVPPEFWHETEAQNYDENGHTALDGHSLSLEDSGSELLKSKSGAPESQDAVRESLDSNAWDSSGLGLDESTPDETAAFMGGMHMGNKITSTPSFVMSSWSSCSATCGTGLRNRRVVCKVYLQFAETAQSLPDSECAGQKPAEAEVCKVASCEHVSSLDNLHDFIWRFTGYSQCSTSCLGGVQFAEFTCVKLSDFSVVPTFYCKNVNTPENKTKSCNVGPCPPVWQIVQVGQCSAACGGGLRVQRVQCLQKVGPAHLDLLVVPDTSCPGATRPARTVSCNEQACPRWAFGPWSQCSSTCGNSTRHRQISCKRLLASGQLQIEPISSCSAPKPREHQVCKRPPCRHRSPRVIVPDTSWFVQLVPTNKLFIDVGGRATILPKTSVKIQCKVRKFNRKHIVWTRNGAEVPLKGRVKRSAGKGVLRIRKARLSDSGVYTCLAGNASETITIDFHSKEQAASKVLDRQLLILRYNINATQPRINLKKYSLLTIAKTVPNINFLPFHYVTGNWSACSKSCGGAGLQKRDTTCELLFPAYYFMVNDAMCVNKGQEKPLDTRDCGYQRCPHWEHEEWSECSDEYCVRRGVGSQRRALMCVSHNSSLVPLTRCDVTSRPADVLECPHERCQPMWQTSPWSKCSRTCGGEGTKTRALHCVWQSTNRPAGAGCRNVQRRPTVIRPCKSNQPCDTGPVRCRDRSNYCSLVTRLNFCRYKHYHNDCCQSCTAHEQKGSGEARRRRRRYYV